MKFAKKLRAGAIYIFALIFLLSALGCANDAEQYAEMNTGRLLATDDKIFSIDGVDYPVSMTLKDLYDRGWTLDETQERSLADGMVIGYYLYNEKADLIGVSWQSGVEKDSPEVCEIRNIYIKAYQVEDLIINETVLDKITAEELLRTWGKPDYIDHIDNGDGISTQMYTYDAPSRGISKLSITYSNGMDTPVSVIISCDETVDKGTVILGDYAVDTVKPEIPTNAVLTLCGDELYPVPTVQALLDLGWELGESVGSAGMSIDGYSLEMVDYIYKMTKGDNVIEVQLYVEAVQSGVPVEKCKVWVMDICEGNVDSVYIGDKEVVYPSESLTELWGKPETKTPITPGYVYTYKTPVEGIASVDIYPSDTGSGYLQIKFDLDGQNAPLQ